MSAQPEITRANLRELFERAFIADDYDTLQRIYAYLQSHGWSGYISAEEAISALERPPSQRELADDA